MRLGKFIARSKKLYFIHSTEGYFRNYDAYENEAIWTTDVYDSFVLDDLEGMTYMCEFLKYKDESVKVGMVELKNQIDSK